MMCLMFLNEPETFKTSFLAQGLDVTKTNVPVVGGHSGITILPLLSQVT